MGWRYWLYRNAWNLAVIAIVISIVAGMVVPISIRLVPSDSNPYGNYVVGGWQLAVSESAPSVQSLYVLIWVQIHLCLIPAVVLLGISLLLWIRGRPFADFGIYSNVGCLFSMYTNWASRLFRLLVPEFNVGMPPLGLFDAIWGVFAFIICLAMVVLLVERIMNPAVPWAVGTKTIKLTPQNR